MAAGCGRAQPQCWWLLTVRGVPRVPSRRRQLTSAAPHHLPPGQTRAALKMLNYRNCGLAADCSFMTLIKRGCYRGCKRGRSGAWGGIPSPNDWVVLGSVNCVRRSQLHPEKIWKFTLNSAHFQQSWSRWCQQLEDHQYVAGPGGISQVKKDMPSTFRMMVARRLSNVRSTRTVPWRILTAASVPSLLIS